MLLIAAAVREEIVSLGHAGWTPLPPLTVGRWPVQRWRTPQGNVAAVATGVGVDACRQALIHLDTHLDLSGILSVGTAGATVEGLRGGDICISERVLFPPAVLAPPAWLVERAARAAVRAQGPPWRFAPSLTSIHALADAESKRTAAEKHGVSWVDMESAAAGQIASRLAIPWLSVRVILDTVEEDLGSVAGQSPGTHRFRLHPGRLRAVARQRRRAREAAGQLVRSLSVLVPEILDEIGDAGRPH